MSFEAGDYISHSLFGLGEVILDRGETVIVRFQQGIQECESSTITPLASLAQTIESGTWQAPLPVILRGLAATIDSLNDRWSVFSRSRVKLLPHQLWVCRKVLERWPFRWLIADDVGLGKTVEAGLILWPLISRRVVQRVLILAPASLVEQWVLRLREMFDLRFTPYTAEADTPRSGFWETHNQVVASLQTLRDDRRGRHDRLLSSPEWDLIIVDEAHHLNADQATGTTLSFRLLQKLSDYQKVQSIIFFTGTPHRGKDYGFLSLLKLLRPDLIDSEKQPLETYLPALRDIMIRNNKQNVTDLTGQLLFYGVSTEVVTYHYSSAETEFYNTLTQFILAGLAYSSSLGGFEGRAVNLVLTSLQKLASSSVAAIRSALRNRLQNLRSRREELGKLQSVRQQIKALLNPEDTADCSDDDIAALDERIVELSFRLSLTENEEEYLETLVSLADSVTAETRIQRILDLLDNRFADRSVLFFTEYKATQSLLMTALIQRYGENAVTFINGDSEARNINGETLRCPRERAVNLFNSGKARFLVSTEAAGEGVDLQQSCYTLIHVDIPWNPMRLHQRVGRLYRYGQTQSVEVITLRNPDTIEADIWAKLEEKMQRIQMALSGVMEEREDLFPMVLGMTSPSIWTEIFSQAPTVPKETLSSWFDTKTKRFGGKDALNTVRGLVGHCASFDYHDIASQLLNINLPALQPFFTGILTFNHRQAKISEEGLAFRTPEAWSGIGIKANYSGLMFDRNFVGPDADQKIVGVGSPLLECALEQARALEASVALLPNSLLPSPLILFSITDRVTESSGSIRTVIVGVDFGKPPRLRQDYEIIHLLNSLMQPSLKRAEPPDDAFMSTSALQAWLKEGEKLITDNAEILDLPFRVPDINPLILLCPEISNKHC
ncbi:DEAD/DEAH box helicase [Nodosilinea sp. E11]|uniref:DEAD/DEAH box helicase n=1 Tax=Nodosilinea sp. E11 TaxID=3037479 RepID=UPI002934DE1E|nr:SNF2-related protein [Nodosilinea sp. E11]WOD39897.1 SNF2-related protein [Nodosilinea sp. E11]